MKKILIIDDEDKLRQLMARILTLEGFDVLQAGDCKTGLNRLEYNTIDLVLCDVKLPDGNGIEMAGLIRAKAPHTEVILLTAYGNFPDSVQAIKNGAFNYIIKGDDNNKIVPLVYQALEKSDLSKRVQHLEKQLDRKFSFDSIIGSSRAVRATIELAKKVAETNTTVLLTGETGTGKEVFAQAIHQASERNSKNFVAINCSAFSHDLLESEMFGHKAGAFTGAMKDKKGLFEEAHNGTIFLDEVGEMALDLQAKVLRVIENGEFIKVGESKVTKINVRIVTATNRNLSDEIQAGRFRQDLYYRLSVFSIYLPPLRDRVADIESLALHYVKEFSLKTNKRIDATSNAYMALLEMHSWPGNVRELKNVIERSVILENSTVLTPSSLPLEIQFNEQALQNGQRKILSPYSMASAEKIQIRKVLSHTCGNKTETAKLLNIALTTLYRKLEEYNIS